MIAESARMSTAREAAFRVQHPNSRPRVIKVLALDEASAAVVRRVAAQGEWTNAAFFTALSADWDPKRPWGTSVQAALTHIDGDRRDLVEEIASADLIVTLSSAGAGAEAVPLISELCSAKRVMITGLLLRGETASEEELART